MNPEILFRKGQDLRNYQLIEKIGQGGSSQVWKARHVSGEHFAIKIFSPDKGMDEVGIGIFKSEFMKSLELNHPNILKPLEYNDFQGRPFIVLPLCDGSLMQEFRMRLYEMNRGLRNDSFVYDEEELCEVIIDVSNAINYLHEKGIIHQDIKPDNILYQKQGNEKIYLISDFGVSTQIKKTILQETQMLSKEKIGLSPDYAAPEMFKGDVQPKSDVFSLGVTLYELATGKMPSKSSTITTGIMLNNGGIIPNLPENFSERFNRLLKGMLHLKIQDRFSPSEIYDFASFKANEGYWPEIKKKNDSSKKLKLFWGTFILTFLLVLLAKYFLFSTSDNIGKLLKANELDQALKVAESQSLKAKEDIKKLLELKATTIHEIKGYLIMKSGNNKSGIVNQDGNTLIDFHYDKIYPFTTDKLILVEKDGYCGYLDIKGNVIIPIKESFCQNYDGSSSIEQFILNISKK